MEVPDPFHSLLYCCCTTRLRCRGLFGHSSSPCHVVKRYPILVAKTNPCGLADAPVLGRFAASDVQNLLLLLPFFSGRVGGLVGLLHVLRLGRRDAPRVEWAVAQGVEDGHDGVALVVQRVERQLAAAPEQAMLPRCPQPLSPSSLANVLFLGFLVVRLAAVLAFPRCKGRLQRAPAHCRSLTACGSWDVRAFQTLFERHPMPSQLQCCVEKGSPMTWVVEWGIWAPGAEGFAVDVPSFGAKDCLREF